MYDARSLYGANATLLPGPAREDSPKGSWVLAEDRPGKPGWMPTRDGDEIDFPLSFGKAPRATIVYTTGYTQEWGAAVVAMSTQGALENFTLSAKHGDSTTISTSIVMNVGQQVLQRYAGGVKGFGVLPFSNATLRLTSSGGKFKVSLVSSC